MFSTSTKSLLPVFVAFVFSSFHLQASAFTDKDKDGGNIGSVLTTSHVINPAPNPIPLSEMVIEPISLFDASCVKPVIKEATATLEVIKRKEAIDRISKEFIEAEKRLKRESTQAKTREAMAKAGQYIPTTDYKATLANFNNGYVTFRDVWESKQKERASNTLYTDPVTCARENMEQLREKITNASIELQQFMGPSNESPVFTLTFDSQDFK